MNHYSNGPIFKSSAWRLTVQRKHRTAHYAALGQSARTRRSSSRFDTKLSGTDCRVDCLLSYSAPADVFPALTAGFRQPLKSSGLPKRLAARLESSSDRFRRKADPVPEL